MRKLNNSNSFIIRVTRLLNYLFDDKLSYSYYPEEPRKNKLLIFLEKLAWLVKYGRINHFYYSYGFDIRGKRKQDDFISYKVFFKIRNDHNLNVRIGIYNSNYICMLKDKFVFNQFLQSLHIPTPRIIALGKKNYLESLDEKQHYSFSDFLSLKEEEYFVKSLGGECADGVFYLRKEDDSLFLNNRQITTEELLEKLPPLYIIQAKIKQHPKLSAIYPHSINTIRLVTINSEGEIHPFAVLLRLGAKGNFVDNWAVGGILVEIDKDSGTLKRHGFFKQGYGGMIERHPDTGITFKDYPVPFFHEAFQLALKTHKYFYGIRSIGWDIAISEDGPVLLEGNDNWEISLHQTVEGGLKNKFLSYM